MTTAARVLGVLWLAGLMAGCATSRSPGELGRVGPDPSAVTTVSADGVLRVFSAYEVRADFSELDRARRRHSDYEVVSVARGTSLRVRNDTSSAAEGPAQVRLAPGEYRVTARANGYGVVVVPVVVEAGRPTEVHLEGGAGAVSSPDPAALVRLPGGEVVGWKAKP